MARIQKRRTKDINLDSGSSRLTLEGALTTASIGLLIALVLQQEAKASMGGDESIRNVRPNWNITRGLPSDISSQPITTDEVVLSPANQLPPLPDLAISFIRDGSDGFYSSFPSTDFTSVPRGVSPAASFIPISETLGSPVSTFSSQSGAASNLQILDDVQSGELTAGDINKLNIPQVHKPQAQLPHQRQLPHQAQLQHTNQHQLPHQRQLPHLLLHQLKVLLLRVP